MNEKEFEKWNEEQHQKMIKNMEKFWKSKGIKEE